MRQPIRRALSLVLVLCMMLGMVPAIAVNTGPRDTGGAWVTASGGSGDFLLSDAVLYVNGAEEAPVKRVVNDLKEDIRRVTGKTVTVTNDVPADGSPRVLVGTLDGSPEVKSLLTADEVKALEGQ